MIHWSYSEQEWQQFATQAWRRGIKTDLLIAGALVGFMLVIGLFILGVSNGAPGAISAMEISLGVAFAVSLLFPLKDVILLRIRRGQSSSEAYISPAGIILGGWYTPLIGLERINYQAGDPAVLGFVTRHSDGRGGTSTRTIEVPVPRGREAEAEQLVSDFKGK